MIGSRTASIGLALSVAIMALGIYAFVHLRGAQLTASGELRALRTRADERMSAMAQRLTEVQRAGEADRQTLQGVRRMLAALQRAEHGAASVGGGAGGVPEKPGASSILPEPSEEKQELMRRAVAATVFIQQEISFRQDGTDRFLHKEGAGPERLRPIVNEKDVQYAQGDAGSGFCVSPDGWIITNAHVVAAREGTSPVKMGGVELVREAVIKVVFSGTDERRVAKVIRVAQDGDDDFAILRVAPFPGIPHIEGFRVDVDLPVPGTPVRFCGFPLGKELRQEKGRLTASVFAGMISRHVAPYLQIQGVFYPGLSGGPMFGPEGRVVGLVTRVQKTSTGAIASDIGFVLPIRRLAKAWRETVK